MKPYLSLLFLILISIAYAEVELEEVYNEEVKDTANITIDKKPFVIRNLENSDIYTTKIIFPNSQTSTLRYPGRCYFTDDEDTCECKDNNDNTIACDCTDVGIYHACLMHVRRGSDKEFDIRTQHYPIYAKLTISKPKTDVQIERNFEKTKLAVGEVSRVEVKIKNTGSKSIIGAKYFDPYPRQVSIIETHNCKQENNRITWTGNPSSSVTVIVYYIKGKNNISFTSRGYLLYGSENESLQQDIEIIASPFWLDAVFSKKKFQLGDTAKITINVKNNNKEFEINPFRHRLYFPDGFKAKKSGNEWFTADYYVYDEKIAEGKNASFSYDIKAEKLGNFTFREKIEYGFRKIMHTVEKEHNIEVTTRPLNIVLPREKFIAGKKAVVPIKIANPHLSHTYKGVDISLESDLPLEKSKAYVKEIKPQQTIEVFMLSFVVPNTEHNIEVNVNYKSPYGDFLEKKEVLSITPVQKEDEEGIYEDPYINKNQTALSQEEAEESSYLLMVAAVSLVVLLIIIIVIIAVFKKRTRSIEKKIDQLE
ncbi:hypothetical protein GF323_01820 [Candidatus Woesearchaeota archaeon]|nr:hypothetical protein [Candidatus Woesearchaeota archaeon]